MSLLIKGMTMPTIGLYFVSVDNTNDKDKTVVTVERILGNGDVRQIIGSFELVPIPPHGRVIDAVVLRNACYKHYSDFIYDRGIGMPFNVTPPHDEACSNWSDDPKDKNRPVDELRYFVDHFWDET